MSIKLQLGEHIIELNENQLDIIGIQFNKEQQEAINNIFAWTAITEKSVSKIQNEKFYVKDYQRGYRWTPAEVIALLDDIADISEEKYCMQPLVVRKDINQHYVRVLDSDGIKDEDNTANDFYEIIDGQQRLTTICLIISECQKEFDYKIYYEQFREIDKKYLEKAQIAIKEWFKKGKADRNQVFEKIKNKLFFVWYEISSNDCSKSSEEIFNNVNAGKVELTNAELFRALLLKNNNTKDAEREKQILQIAFEWDEIEQSLQNDEFWYFIAGDTNKETTRIDYILELYARKINDTNNTVKKDERFSFNVVKEKLKDNGSDSTLDVWKEIVNIYECLNSWFLDDTLYHLIGFLVCCEEEKNKKIKTLSSDIICELCKENHEKSKLKNILWKKASKEIFNDKAVSENNNATLNHIKNIEDVSYGDYSGRILRACLLFFNVWTCMQNRTKSKFSFFSYKTKKWDIEHINPQNMNKEFRDETSEPDKENYISYLKDYAEFLSKSDDDSVYNVGKELLDKLDSSDSFDNRWKSCVEIINEKAADNNISNLTLLDSKINRSYGNAFFREKRKEIIKNDEKGVFIPPCTKNVFLKYYSEKDIDTVAWSQENKETYLEKLRECFENLSIYAQEGDN